jgi:hypothetical protein
MACDEWVIQLTVGERTYSLFRTWFDEDGTYSVTASYHRANTATIFSALTFFGVERSAIVGASLRRVSLQDDDKRRN